MPKCPECYELIDHLILFERFERSYRVNFDKGKVCRVGECCWKVSDGEDVYGCPKCNSVLCRDEEQAERFLRKVVNDGARREKLAKAVVERADHDEVFEMAVAGCLELYMRDDEQFQDDWYDVFGVVVDGAATEVCKEGEECQ